jgi:hypothetical protein
VFREGSDPQFTAPNQKLRSSYIPLLLWKEIFAFVSTYELPSQVFRRLKRKDVKEELLYWECISMIQETVFRRVRNPAEQSGY